MCSLGIWKKAQAFDSSGTFWKGELAPLRGGVGEDGGSLCCKHFLILELCAVYTHQLSHLRGVLNV